MSETGDKVVSDEERVMAARPELVCEPRGEDWFVVGYWEVQPKGAKVFMRSGEGSTEAQAWAYALQHPAVAAFEAQHRPASQPQNAELPPDRCGGDGTYPSVPLAVEPQKSGKLLLRIPKSIHAQAEKIAEAEGVSLNQWLSTSIAMIVARAALGQAVVPQDRLEAIAADSFCEHAECSTDSAKVGVCAACDAIYAARECLRLHASIKPEAPEGAKVTWAVEDRMFSNPWVRFWTGEVELERDADGIIARHAASMGDSRYSVRKLKITTTEEVVAVREAGK